MEVRRYRDKDGVTVLDVCMTGRGTWRAYRRGVVKGKPLRPVESRQTFEQAQADLDAYAAKHKLEEV